MGQSIPQAPPGVVIPFPGRRIEDETRAVYDAGGPTPPPADAPPRASQSCVGKACGVMAAGLYGILCERADPDGYASGTMPDLAAEFGYSDRHFRRTISALEAHGFLSRETVTGQRGAATGVRFRLPVPGTTYAPDTGVSADTTPDTTPDMLTRPDRAGGPSPVSKSLRSNERNSGVENERETTPLSPPKGTNPRTEPVPRKRKLPEDFAVTDDMMAWAAEKGITPAEVVEQTEQFKDHHRHKGTLGIDWPAGWRTWMANALRWGHVGPLKNGRLPSPRSAPPPPPMVERGKAPADGGMAAWKSKGRAQ